MPGLGAAAGGPAAACSAPLAGRNIIRWVHGSSMLRGLEASLSFKDAAAHVCHTCAARTPPGAGAVYVIDAEERAVEVAAQLHTGAVAVLAAHAGFVASGSADCLLRLWGSDLQQASMEAQHEGSVTGGAARGCVGGDARCCVGSLSRLTCGCCCSLFAQALGCPPMACAWLWAPTLVRWACWTSGRRPT